MKQEFNIEDFLQLINDSFSCGFKVSFVGASFHSQDWAAEHHIEHIMNLYNNRKETNISFVCESIMEDNRIKEVKVFERHPASFNHPSKEEWTLWRVVDQKKKEESDMLSHNR